MVLRKLNWLAALVGVTVAAPAAHAGTIVYEDRSHRDADLDRVRAQIWAMDDDGSNRRLVASTADNADVEQHGPQAGYISYSQPSTTAKGSDVVFSASAVGGSSTACNPVTFCQVHFGFNIDGVRVWRDGKLRDLTPRWRPCFNCTSFYSDPEQTRGGDWAGWYEHFQGGDTPVSSSINSWALGALRGSARLRDTPCPRLALGPIAAHPTRAGTVAFTCGLALGRDPWRVFVGNRDGTGARQIAELPLSDDHAALGWTPSGDGLIVRVFDEAAPQQAGLYLLNPSASPQAQAPQLMLGEPAGTEFQTVNAAGKRIVVGAAQGPSRDALTNDVWTIPASCRGCSFPSDAKRLTRDGASANPDWTSVEGLGLVQIRTSRPRVSGDGRVPVKLACPAGPRRCRGRLRLRTAGKVKLSGSRRRITVARASYRVPAGKVRTVAAKLTGSGRALVARRARLRVEITLRTSSRNTSERTATLRG